jgi:hypothetical protein
MSSYFTINKNDKTFYIQFKISKTLKNVAWNGKESYYYIEVSEFIVDNTIDFDDSYGGLFLYKTEDNQLKIYNNIEKCFENLDELSSGDNILLFEYNSKHYTSVDLECIIKEILYNIFVNKV